MNRFKIVDTHTGKTILYPKSVKQAEQAIFRLHRQNRHTGNFTPNQYVIISSSHRQERMNKQARRAFELQEV